MLLIMAKRITRFPRLWTEGEIHYLIEYRSTGMSFEAIAVQLGRTMDAVYDKWERLQKKAKHDASTRVQPVPPYLRLAAILLGFAILGFCGVYVALSAPVV